MIGIILKDEWRFLTFRSPSAVIRERPNEYLGFGLICAWAAGIGRYWDNPRADLWQHLGLGSVLYVFVLAFSIWILLIPLKPSNWKYRNVLLFVSLTSPPAILYAIPVERFISVDGARAANAWFLAAVAVWRVALLSHFLLRTTKLPVHVVIVGTLLPLTVIVIALTMLNLEHVVFNIMSGIAPENRSPNDTAYSVVFVLSMFSFIAAPFLALAYVIIALNRRSAAQQRVGTDT